MNAHIITGLNSGLGDMYSNIYRVYDVQQQLKNLGYTVYVYIDFTRICPKHFSTIVSS